MVRGGGVGGKTGLWSALAMGKVKRTSGVGSL